MEMPGKVWVRWCGLSEGEAHLVCDDYQDDSAEQSYTRDDIVDAVLSGFQRVCDLAGIEVRLATLLGSKPCDAIVMRWKGGEMIGTMSPSAYPAFAEYLRENSAR